MHWLVIARQGVDLHTNTLGQALASEYLSGGHLARQLPKILDLYRPRREAILEALANSFPEDFRWTRPEGGMFIWAEGPAGLDTEKLYRRALERNVAFVPGKFFYVDHRDGLATMRMNFTAADPATIAHAIELLGQAIAEELHA